MKFAVATTLNGKKYENAEVGESLERVLRYWTVRGKFDGVHPALQKIGVKKIEVKRNSLMFVGDND